MSDKFDYESKSKSTSQKWNDTENHVIYNNFTSLRCWQYCREVKLFFYERIIPKLPKEEMNNVGFQIRKSTRSITANIAEGAGRYHYQEAIQFLRISRGSLDELLDDLIFCSDRKYLTPDIYQEGEAKIKKAKASLNGFIKYNETQKLKSKQKGRMNTNK
jgi:four helix bundle protein